MGTLTSSTPMSLFHWRNPLRRMPFKQWGIFINSLSNWQFTLPNSTSSRHLTQLVVVWWSTNERPSSSTTCLSTKSSSLIISACLKDQSNSLTFNPCIISTLFLKVFSIIRCKILHLSSRYKEKVISTLDKRERLGSRASLQLFNSKAHESYQWTLSPIKWENSQTSVNSFLNFLKCERRDQSNRQEFRLEALIQWELC